MRDHDVLAIEPECYRRWLNDARLAASAALMERALSPEAAERLKPSRAAAGNLAVVNLSGFISQKPSLMTMLFGGTSAEWFAATIRGAMTDPDISAVVMNVDTPGGGVFGVPEAAAAIRSVRGSKPLVAVSNPLMASAGYWLASQADEIVAIPSSITGSIGVKVVHVDESEALKREGLSVTEIVYGRRKVEDSSAKPLSDEAQAAIQARVDYFGHMFEADVARGRRVSVATVRAKYGDGAVFTAQEALAAGMVDRIGTLEEVLGDLSSGRRTGARAEVEAPAIMSEMDLVEMRARAALAGVRLEE